MNWYEDEKQDKDKKSKKKDAKDDTVYQSYVALRREEDFVMPVEVEIKFDNGEKVREHWDGQSRWTRYSYQKKAKVVSAEIDPDHTVQIDRNNFNNSLRGRGEHKAYTQIVQLLDVCFPVGGTGAGLVGGLSKAKDVSNV